MAKKLEGKVALITGGSEGIGLATAKLFLEEGAFVYITGRREKELAEAVKKLGGKNIVGIQGDVSKLEDLDRLYAQIKKEKGKIDILFANAGVYEICPIEQVTEAHFDKIYNINVKGLVFGVIKALPIFRDGGSIILNASVAGIKGVEGFSIYSSTKAALRSFARTWTSDLKKRKIRVNSLSPGFITTEGANTFTKGDQEVQKQFVAGVPMGRPGKPEEIAKAALFLASDDSSYITGIDLDVDGGLAQV